MKEATRSFSPAIIPLLCGAMLIYATLQKGAVNTLAHAASWTPPPTSNSNLAGCYYDVKQDTDPKIDAAENRHARTERSLNNSRNTKVGIVLAGGSVVVALTFPIPPIAIVAGVVSLAVAGDVIFVYDALLTNNDQKRDSAIASILNDADDAADLCEIEDEIATGENLDEHQATYSGRTFVGGTQSIGGIPNGTVTVHQVN